MKYTTKEILEINTALISVSNRQGLEKSINYAVARNILKIKKILSEFQEENTARINVYALKDEKGKPIVIDDLYNFGNNADEAQEKYEELLKKEHEIELYSIKRSDETDKLPGGVLVILLDKVIIDHELDS